MSLAKLVKESIPHLHNLCENLKMIKVLTKTLQMCVALYSTFALSNLLKRQKTYKKQNNYPIQH